VWLALDIGGANIKAADGLGYSAIEPFALWRHPDRLAGALRKVIDAAPPCNRVAATMTGELADCFATKTEGVVHILDALDRAASGRETCVYRLDGKLVASHEARHEPLSVAAANWHALASFAGRFTKGKTALLFDIGSTTTDVIPLVDGHPQSQGKTDTERLLSGELVYTGVERSPVCAVVEYLPYREKRCPVAQELFATTWDAYLTLNELPEEPENINTADGRPATRVASQARLARCLCEDLTNFTERDALAAAEAIRRRQSEMIAVAVGQVIGRLAAPVACSVLSGRGEFLARRVLEKMKVSVGLVSLAEKLGARLSCCAPAHALAVLARERYSL
jgi:probable H4MPT-linked C1 transfer pathway protein